MWLVLVRQKKKSQLAFTLMTIFLCPLPLMTKMMIIIYLYRTINVVLVILIGRSLAFMGRGSYLNISTFLS